MRLVVYRECKNTLRKKQREMAKTGLGEEFLLISENDQNFNTDDCGDLYKIKK